MSIQLAKQFICIRRAFARHWNITVKHRVSAINASCHRVRHSLYLIVYCDPIPIRIWIIVVPPKKFN